MTKNVQHHLLAYVIHAIYIYRARAYYNTIGVGFCELSRTCQNVRQSIIIWYYALTQSFVCTWGPESMCDNNIMEYMAADVSSIKCFFFTLKETTARNIDVLQMRETCGQVCFKL